MGLKIINFFCEWSSFPGLKLSKLPDGKTISGNNYIISMCQGRISPELILEAFSNGADGVLIACCPPDECEHNGNYKARRRVLLLKKTMEQLGINPDRLRLEWISKGDTAKFNSVVKEFSKVVSEL
jgi:F420-non-reducing hydrogenase iron-sulfur subunit